MVNKSVGIFTQNKAGRLTFWTAAFPGLARNLPEGAFSSGRASRASTDYVG